MPNEGIENFKSILSIALYISGMLSDRNEYPNSFDLENINTLFERSSAKKKVGSSDLYEIVIKVFAKQLIKEEQIEIDETKGKKLQAYEYISTLFD